MALVQHCLHMMIVALVPLIMNKLPSKDQWRLRSSSKKIAEFMDQWHLSHDTFMIYLGTFVEMASLLRFQAHGTPAFSKLSEAVTDRVMYDRMGPLRKWFKDNRVFMDEGGFYTRVSNAKRVRIGLWETGVDFVKRQKAVGFARGRAIRFHTKTWAVLRDGYETYAPAAIAA